MFVAQEKKEEPEKKTKHVMNTISTKREGTRVEGKRHPKAVNGRNCA